MGKLNLTKQNKKQNKSSRGNSGIPNWLLTTIVVVVIAAVLISCAASLLSNSGIVMRMSDAMESDNFKVNGNMMAYYYVNTYSNFATNYSSMLSYFSLGANTPISEHRNIQFGGTAENPNTYDQTLGTFEGTWFDYFMSQTQSSVKTMLVYCEEAVARGIELTAEDKTNIDAAITSNLLQFRLSNGATGLSDSTCIKAMYGEGISKGDIKKAMELSTLASKCSEVIYDEIEAAVTDAAIDSEYASSKKDYDLVDYFYYRFNVNFSDIEKEYDSTEKESKKDEILAKYKEKIEEYKKLTAELSAITDLAKFKEYIYNYVANDQYTDLYDEVVKDLKDDEKLADADLPSEEQLKIIKEKLIAAVIEQVAKGDTEAADDVKVEGEKYTVYDIEITKAFATAVNDLKDEVFDVVSGAESSYNMERVNYTKDDDFSEWAFSDAATVGAIKNIQNGDNKNDETMDPDKKDGYFRSTVYYITKAARKDEENSRNVSYMLYTSTDAAKAAIEKIKALETLNKDTFLGLATETGASANTTYENYMKGDMQSATFDSWLYGDSTKIGSYTTTPLTMTDGSVMVAYYGSEGEVGWKVTVKAAIIEEKFTEAEKAMDTAHSAKVSSNTWVLNRVGK